MKRNLKEGRGLKVVRSSMLEEIGITLRDFFPKDRGHLMRAGNATVVISTRLRDALRAYATQRGISLIEALEQLRDEVQDRG